MVSFFNFDGLYSGSWVLFLMIAAISRMLGKNILFKKLQVPFITGYMITGFLCGPYVLHLITVEQVEELGYVNKIALSFIAISAGAEIDLHEILPLLKPVLSISASMTGFTMFLCTLFIFFMGQTVLLSWVNEFGSGCGFSISLILATILSARSPTSVLAVVRELQAKGPTTSLMIAITVGGDIIVLTLFAITTGIARSMCSGDGFDAAALFIDISLIFVAFIWGGLLGLIIIGCLNVQYMEHLILPIGFITYLTCDFILADSEEETAYSVSVDALLVCIAAGFVTTNYSSKHTKLIDYLKRYSKYVFIPFFTGVGLSINLPVLIHSFVFSMIACSVRAFCMFLGTVSGGAYAGVDKKVGSILWLGLLPQAGVSLGLAGVVAAVFKDTFGVQFQSTVIGIILINQIIGPLGAKYLIKQVGEDNKGMDKKLENTPWMQSEQAKTYLEIETQTDDDIEGLVLAQEHALAALKERSSDAAVTIEMTPVDAIQNPMLGNMEPRLRTNSKSEQEQDEIGNHMEYGTVPIEEDDDGNAFNPLHGKQL